MDLPAEFEGKSNILWSPSTPLRPLNEAKLILIGQGSVGKTSLIRRLLENQFSPSENKTDGITINHWNIRNKETPEEKGTEIKISAWDFGGQEIMHATHQFFLTKRSLYLLILDSRLTQQENRVEYWLKIIQSFGGESPILIVGNKIDQSPLDIDRTDLKKKYPNIVGILETSAATSAGMEALSAAITEQVFKLPHVRDLLPETWLTVKAKLEELGRVVNFITYEKYIDLCIENEINDEISQQTLIGFLHDLGVVLHFQDDIRLGDIGILNPQWVTNGVYKIFNSHVLFENKGVLTVSMINEILNLPEYPRDKRLFIVDVMKKFELCYDLEPDKTFLVPDLLPKDEPYTGDWESALGFLYHYNVLPSSVISRFIVRMNQYIYNAAVWRSGVVIKRESNRALIKADIEEQRIYIWVDGNETTRRDLLSIVRSQFEAIHKTIAKLGVQAQIPLLHSPEVVVDYEYLLGFEKEGKTEIYISGLSEPINVSTVLDSIVSRSERVLEEKQKTLKPYSEINKSPRMISDQPIGADKLNYLKYANAIASLVKNPETNTPLTIGIYGNWGSGKSFLMGKIKEQIIQGAKSTKKPVFTFKKKTKKSEVDIHIVEFNAWVYSGSEHLWASLVTHLYRDIEKHFGVKVHAKRMKRAFIKSVAKDWMIFSFYGILGIIISLLFGFVEIQQTSKSFGLAFFNTITGWLIGGSILATLPALFTALRDFFDSLLLSRAKQLQALAARPDFKSQIGVMADIKEEIKFIRELLTEGKHGSSTRIALFIDDLDRCEHRKAVEVLQSIMLLLADEDGSPFVIFLGIDARVIVRAVEEFYGEVLVKAGINGYEYLDKVIQIPFVIPSSNSTDIENYVDSLLYASEEEKLLLETFFRPVEEKTEPVPEVKKDIPPAQVASTSKSQSAEIQNVDSVDEEAGQVKKDDKPEETPTELSVTFTQAEREAIKSCISDLTDNPRKIKRIVNIYRLMRLILKDRQDRAKAVRWVLLTEQWAYHIAWIVEYIENDIQTKNEFKDKKMFDVYQAAKSRIHDVALSTLLGIDSDPYLFENFIQKEPTFTVQEILSLLPFTFNLNPAIRSEVSKQMLKTMESKPESKKPASKKKKSSVAKAAA